ncbi:MAG: SurA N-terminal domain-containing protein [Gammaproteobacteria bacterium]
MLQVMRDKAQGWIAGIIIGAIAIAFTFIGTGNFFMPNGNQNVAKVNGQEIPWQRFAERYEQVRAQNESVSSMDTQQLKSMLLENMVRELALMQASEKRGFRVSTQQINQLIQNINIFQEDGKFSYDRLNQLLQQLHLSQYEFHHQIQEMMMVAQMEEGLRDSAFSLMSDLGSHLKYLNQKRHVKYAEIDRKQFESEVTITEDELKQYYDAHPQKFMTDETAQIEYIELPLTSLLDKIEVSSSDLSEYYEEHKNVFETPEKVKVSHILISSQEKGSLEKAKAEIETIQNRLKQGESFEALAREFSDDPVSAKDGGVLDWVTKGEVVPQFEEAAFNLNKPGEISDIIQTGFGYHLIKLIAHQDTQLKPFDVVKDEIAAEIRRQKAEEQQINLADEMVTLAYEHHDSLQPIADKIDQPIQTSEPFTRKGGKGILADPTVLGAVFSDDVLVVKQNSDLIKIEPDTYVVLRLKTHQPSELKPYEAVKTEVEGILRDNKLNEKLKSYADSIVEGLKKSQSIDLIASEKKLNFIDKTVTRSEINLDRAVLSKAFSIPRPVAGTFEVGSTPISKGYAIVLVDDVQDGQLSEVPSDRISFIQGFLANSLGEIDYDLYVSEIIKQAKVEKFLPAQTIEKEVVE